MHEETLKKETMYRGHIIDVEVREVVLHDGQRAVREVVRHKGAVSVLARLPNGSFIFVRQFRAGAQQVLLEVVAGVKERGEDPLDCAKRELKEETGYDTKTIRQLGVIYPTPGYVDEKIDVFFAELSETPGAHDRDEGEHLEVVSLSESEFIQKIRNGEVPDAKTLAAWTLYKNEP